MSLQLPSPHSRKRGSVGRGLGPRRISRTPLHAPGARGDFDGIAGPVLRAGPDVHTRLKSPQGHHEGDGGRVAGRHRNLTARGRHNAPLIRHSVGGKVAIHWNIAWSVAIRTLRADIDILRPDHLPARGAGWRVPYVIKRSVAFRSAEPRTAPGRRQAGGARRHDMAQQPARSDSGAAPRPPPARPSRRPWDRYDAIGAAVVVFLAALWVLHFLLPAPPPPTDVP